MPGANHLALSARVRSTLRPQYDTALSEWLRVNGISFYGMAQKIGCRIATLKCWANGQQMPGLVSAFKVDKATGGAVPVSSWLGTAIGKAQWEAGCDWENLKEKDRGRANRLYHRTRSVAAREARSNGKTKKHKATRR